MNNEIEAKVSRYLADEGRKRGYLTKLAARGEFAAVELETPYQVALAKGMAKLGYVRYAATAICGVVRVPGDFVSITEAGRRFAGLAA